MARYAETFQESDRLLVKQNHRHDEIDVAEVSGTRPHRAGARLAPRVVTNASHTRIVQRTVFRRKRQFVDETC